MAVVNRESGLDDIKKIFFERKIPRFYEKCFAMFKAFFYDRIHGPAEMKIIQNGMNIEPFPIFGDIEIATVNRCNGDCSFFPVKRNVDPRKFTFMNEELFF